MNNPMILCCGEALVDLIPSPTASGAEGFVPHNGGSVFNTAIALGRLGVSAGLVTGLSSDMFGQSLLAGLRASHVDTSQIVISDRPSTLAFVQLIESQARYSFFDEGSAGRMIALSDIAPFPPEVSALFFGGISLACEPCADTYAALLAREGGSRAVMIDPNIRPSFIAEPDRYHARLEGMMSACDILKLSDEDLDWLDGTDRPIEDKITALHARGPAVVIVTQGADGAVGYHSNGTCIHAKAPQVKVVDTVGAGDAFNAGVLAALAAQGKLSKSAVRAMDKVTLQEALKHGTKVAAFTVSKPGANPR